MSFNDRRHSGWTRQLEQRFQVEIRGHWYYVVDTVGNATVGGPYKGRERAQVEADRWERAAG